MTVYDVVVRGGLVFDGSDSAPKIVDVGVRGDRIAAIGKHLDDGMQTIDATGRWVIPGIVDAHTHYDAEILANPGLGESARHGVTTVIFGNCSLSTVYCDANDCADMFARVEALPRSVVHSTVEEAKTWHDPAGYTAAIEALPLGINVGAFIGHSDMRVATMGLGRSLDRRIRPTRDELDQMRRMLADALDAGFVGLSTIRSSWSKLDGTRYPARQLPSTYASWGEYHALNKILRKRGRVHQSTPNLTRRAEAALYLIQSIGGGFRKPLKTTLITAADIKANRSVARVATAAATGANLLGGQFRWQHLPVPFEVYADGVDLVVFEEFGSGAAALNIRDALERDRLLADEDYRRRFRKDIAKRFGPRVWNRDLADAQIVSCPDRSVIGKSFADVAQERGITPADALLDLTVEHTAELRWRTIVANDRDDVLDRLQRSPAVQVGFADSGAHLRNMAFYNSGVRMLERVHRRGFMSIQAAVHRLSGELADWYGLDTGHLEAGRRADIAVIDPAGFDGSSGDYAEAPYPCAHGVKRMVNRNDRAVTATMVGGTIVYAEGQFATGFGTTLHAGKFLRSRDSRKVRAARPVLHQ